jgi:hypothetical protein
MLSELFLGTALGLAAGVVLVGILTFVCIYFAPRRNRR